MHRITFLSILVGFLVGLTLGCGQSKGPEVVVADTGKSTNSGDPPKVLKKDDLPAAKARLAELEKAIAAKEKELAALRAEADGLRKTIVLAEGKVYRSPAELFAGMPKDLYPKSSDTGIERTATRKWIDGNLLGGSYEWEANLTGFKAEGEAEPLHVRFATDERVKTYYLGGFKMVADVARDAIALGQIKLGDQECEVYLRNWTSRTLGLGARECELTEYLGCSLAEAKALRAFDNTKATLRGRITEVEIHNMGWAVRGEAAASKRVAFLVTLHSAAVNGYLPEKSRPPEKK